jgi:hypothetical protein
MVSPLFFSQLALIALVWLFLVLHYAWPQECAKHQRAAAREPRTPKRPRAKEPKPFAGLTQRPPCALCEREATLPPSLPPVPPDPMSPPHRRPRPVDTSQHFCPHAGCRYRGWLGRGNLRATGHPSGGPWRQLQCTACEGYFPEHHGTIFYGKQAAVERIVHVLACVAEGLGMRATARVFEVDAKTVLHWRVAAAEQLTAFSASLLCDLHGKQLQLDALYAVLRDLNAGAINEDQAIQRLERSPYWVWTAMEPNSKWLLGIDVGPRTLAMAQRVVHQVVQRLAPGCVPLCFTDGLKDAAAALLTHFGQWRQPERRQDNGLMPKPRWVPLPELLYAQGVQSYRRRRIVGGKYRVVFGTMERVQQGLAACGRKINTAFVERLNLDIRQRVAAVGRRVNTLCQGADGVRQQVGMYQVYDNFCLPHSSLRQLLPVPEATNGRGAAKVWRPCTPAMAAGVTDHVWTLKAVWLFRVPPWPQPQTV